MKLFGFFLLFFFILYKNTEDVLASEKITGDSFSTTISGEQGSVDTEINIIQQPTSQTVPETTISPGLNNDQLIRNEENSVTAQTTQAPVVNNQTGRTDITYRENTNSSIPTNKDPNYYQAFRLSNSFVLFLILESLAGLLFGLGLVNLDSHNLVSGKSN